MNINKYILIYRKGEKTGFGHFSRINSIIEVLKTRNISYSKIELNDNNQFPRIDIENKIIIIDVPDTISKQWFDIICQKNLTVIIDNFKNKEIIPDILILPGIHYENNFHENNFHENNFFKAKIKVLKGLKYLLLRKGFFSSENYNNILNSEYLPVFINFGATDPFNYNEKILGIFNNFSLKIHIFYLGKKEIILKNNNIKITHIPYISNPAEIMQKTVCAIVSFGITTYELIVCGIPSLVITHNKEDEEAVKRLEQQGLCRFLGRNGELDIEKMKNITKTFFDKNEIQKISNNLLHKLDDKGAERIIEFIEKNEI